MRVPESREWPWLGGRRTPGDRLCSPAGTMPEHALHRELLPIHIPGPRPLLLPCPRVTTHIPGAGALGDACVLGVGPAAAPCSQLALWGQSPDWLNVPVSTA